MRLQDIPWLKVVHGRLGELLITGWFCRNSSIRIGSLIFIHITNVVMCIIVTRTVVHGTSEAGVGG